MPRLLRVAGPALLVVVSFLALLAGLAIGGGASAPVLADPGAFVRYGLPMATLLVNLSAAATIGSLVLTCFALSSREAEFNTTLDFAAGAAALLTVTSAITGFLTFLSVTGIPVSGDQQFSSALGSFVGSVSIGQAWLYTTLIAAAVTVLCFAVRNHTALVFVTALALLALLPMAQQGHAADTAGHDAAVTSLGLHLVFVAIWLGGLVTIIVVRRTLDAGRIIPVIQRYSTLALICFVVVAVSGYVNAALRIGTLQQLATPYGILVLIKVAALVSIGLFGLMQRRFVIEKLRSGSKTVFWWMVTAELGFMAIASGVAAALARTATPVAETIGSAPTPAQILTGEPLPAPATLMRYLTGWNFDLGWIFACGFGIFFYLAGVWRLRRRGESWPVYRTICWVAGLLLLFYLTNGGINMYEKYLFSAQLIAHVALAMMVPVLLVPGAPVTLALRAIAERVDGSRGPREWITLVVHSRVAGFFTNPIVAFIVFSVSLWVLFYSPMVSWATTDHIGHEAMIVYLLVTGYLFVLTLIGIDPVRYRLPYPFRLVLLVATMAIQAFFGIIIMTSTGLLLADWFGAMGRTSGAGPLADQQMGAGVAWAAGEFAAVILVIVLVVLWARRSSADDDVQRVVVADRDGQGDGERHVFVDD